MIGNWKKVTADRAGDLVTEDELDEQSRSMFDPEGRPDALVRDLAGAQLWSDAVKLASRTLPPRESVWWACVCARKMASINDNPEEMSALQSAESWVYKPNDENRKNSFDLAQASDLCLAGGLSAFAATFNDSTLPLVDGTEAELDKVVFSSMVSGAVMLSAGDAQPDQVQKRFEQFLQSAEDIANGGDGRIMDSGDVSDDGSRDG